MLADILAHSDNDQFAAEIISLKDKGSVAARIEGLGVPVRAVHMNYLTAPIALVVLGLLIFKSKPDVIQTWMYHSNLLGGVVARLTNRAPVVWGIHATQLDPSTLKFGTYLAIWGGRIVSRWVPARIICCSEAAREFHEFLGYTKSAMRFIPNGFDLSRFRPDAEAYQSVRAELGLREDANIVGLITRYHPNKDHANFLHAAAILRRHMPDVHFICCGRNVTMQNQVLAEKVREHHLDRHVTLLGERHDIPRLTAALNLAVSSSHIGEAFPLSLGEAMACGVPCVTTNVGDSASLVGATGRIVPTRDPEALAKAWQEILLFHPEQRRELGNKARGRVMELFSIQEITKQYEYVYKEISDFPHKDHVHK